MVVVGGWWGGAGNLQSCDWVRMELRGLWWWSAVEVEDDHFPFEMRSEWWWSAVDFLD